jgi:hypothetical protein
MDTNKIVGAVAAAAAVVILGYVVQQVTKPSPQASTQPPPYPSLNPSTGGTQGGSYSSNVNGDSGVSVSPTSGAGLACPF